MKIHDISPLISPRLAVFPGDVAFSREVSMSFSKGEHLELSSITTTLHLGAHADSTSHYHREGSGVETRDLRAFFGRAQVLSLPVKGRRISVADLAGIEIEAPRVLFRTMSFPDPDSWSGDFSSLSHELIHHLHQQGVLLVGIDTPSVDPATDKELPSHQALWETKMAVLEGLVLDQVQPGLYELIALPLKIADGDASPVRAVLLQSQRAPL